MKKKNLLAAVFFFVSVNGIYGQSPAWEWAKGAGGKDWDYGIDIATDKWDNIYIVGSSSSDTITFSPYNLPIHTGGICSDMFIAKYNGIGNVLWAKVAGSLSSHAYSVATDSSGNVYVTGDYALSEIIFDSITLRGDSSYEMFVVKYDSDGDVQWAKSAGGKSFEMGRSITIDKYNNIYVVGSFWGTSITCDSVTLNTAGNGDIFIIKYDSNGNMLWAKSAGGTDFDDVYQATTDDEGNLYVTGGYFSPAISFDSVTLFNTGLQSVFIVKYNGNGDVVWARKNQAGNGSGKAIISDTLGNIYVAGSFGNAPISFDTTTLASAGKGDIFVTKYDSNGNISWAKSAGGADEDAPNKLAIDKYSNILITGGYRQSITFGNTVLNAAGFYDVFVSKYDSAGNALWAKSAGGVKDDYGYGIALDNNENIYINGSYSNTADFGNHSLTDNCFIACGNVYLAKLSSTVDINEAVAKNSSLLLYPNPTHHTLTVAFNTATVIAHVTLYDLTGRIILEKTFADIVGENKIEIDVSGVARGVYVVSVRTPSERVAGADNFGREERGMVVVE